MNEYKGMHKAMRQMPEQPGRAGRRHGEAGPDTASDETGGTLHEHPDTGSAKSMASTGGLLEAALTATAADAATHQVTEVAELMEENDLYGS